jgi:murein DD-endopeptidase MepM/ murein hydrolase activator NlpD
LPVLLLLSTLTDPMRLRSTHRVLPLVVAALVLAVPVSPSGATARADRRTDLKNQIAEVSQQEAAALAQLQATQASRAQVEARVSQLDAERRAAEAQLAPLEADPSRLADEYSALVARVETTKARLAAAQHKLDQSAAGMYRSERRGSTYDSVFAARPDSLLSEQHYLNKVSDQRQGIVVHVKELRDDLERQQRALGEQKAKADAAAAAARAVRDQIAALRAQIEPARASLQQQQLYESIAVEALAQSKAQAEAELAALQATSDSIGARLRARGGSGGGAPCQVRPVPGPIVSGFGMRYHPILHTMRMHTGVDMSASEGDPIHACRGGVVVIAGPQGGYGNCVVIDHGGGMATLYAHQSRIAVSEGQTVNAGDVIGYIGHTGLATGPHLHFEVRLGGNPVDPAPYL